MKIAFASVPLIALAAASAGCAAASAPPRDHLQDGRARVALGEHARFGRIDVVPLRVEEDSRCPVGVQCIQAGTVRVLVRIRDQAATVDAVLTLEEPVPLASGGALSLLAVCPYPRHPHTIAKGAYRFVLAMGVKSPPPPANSGCDR